MVVEGLGATAVETGREVALPIMLSAMLPPDRDGDTVPDAIDDCPDVFDPDQNDPCGAIEPEAVDLGTRKMDAAPPNNNPVDLAGAPDLTPVAGPAVCGDGILQAGEACDDGAANSDTPSASGGCTSQCQLRAGCGSLSGSSGAQIDPANGHCYVAWPNALNWASASRQCQARGGHLATVTSAAENARIATLAGASDRWIGLKIDHGFTPRDTWVDGETAAFTDYALGEPNNGGTSGNPEACGAYEIRRAAWDDRPCGYPATGMLDSSLSYTLGYICENECGNGVVDPGEECEGGAGCTATCQKVRACSEPGAASSPINGHCYFALTTPLAFTDALAACPAGTHLATLDEIAESEAGALASSSGQSWIALRAAVTQGQFAWAVGSDVFDSLRYHGFMGSEPNDTSTPPICARIDPLQGWKDQPCANLYPALCERE
jgi:hypothetical protein